MEEKTVAASASEPCGEDSLSAGNSGYSEYSDKVFDKGSDRSDKKDGKKFFDNEEIRKICIEEGAFDAGFVEIEREALASEKEDILKVYPRTRSIISLVHLMNRENIKTPARYLYANEINHSDEELSTISRKILRRLNRLGIRGVAVTPAFPMDMRRYPGKIWDVSHKKVAVEAGLGHMGINRLVLHPEQGSSILLNSILIDADIKQYGAPLQDNPCFKCGLCVAACPVGAIKKDAPFDLVTCMLHSYRDNAIGFADWIDALMTSENSEKYSERFRPSETASLWQSLMYRLDYKCGYCMAVCPAGKEVEPEYHKDRKSFMEEVLKPLKEREEPVYVIPGSDAEKKVRQNQRKEVRYVKVNR